MSDQGPEQPPESAAESAPPPEDTDADSYLEIQQEVEKNFDGNWEHFLKALSNPSEVLYFVLWRHCEGKADKFEAWARSKDLPPDWVPRFYGMLTEKGEFRPDVVTRPPSVPPAAAAAGDAETGGDES